MKPGKLTLLVIFIGLLLFVSGCSSKGYLASRNIAGIYRPEKKLKGIGYALFNLSDSLTRLYFRFPLESLEYRQVSGSRPYSEYRLDYQVFDGYEKGVMVDSGSFRGADSLRLTGLIEDSVTLKTIAGKNYIIQVSLTDNHSRITNSRFLDLPKFLHNGPGDFLLTDVNNKPLMRDYILRNERVRIRARFPQDSLVRITFYKINAQAAAKAPFDFTSAFSGLVEDEPAGFGMVFHGRISEPMMFQPEGLYIDALTNGKRFHFCRHYDGFPQIGSVEKMREATCFISTGDESLKMSRLPARQAVDDFWTGLTGNSDRALSQIRRYYGRVEEANGLFSYLMEGWKTDRGMIYIIFGPPTMVYRNSEVEEWTYGEPGNPFSIRFYFHRIAFSGGIEDYILSRSEDYRRPWHLAVSNWRR